jgi:predicted DNA-binding transcriptional regulator YafY
MAYSRIHRLLKIVSLVQSGRSWTAKALAAECSVNVRSVYRDLDELREAGIPVEFDKSARSYRITGSFFMPPVHLTGEEALALTALCEHISKPQRIPFLDAAWRALHKIEMQLPAAIRRELATTAPHIAIQTGPAMPPDGHGDVYQRVKQAISESRMLRCAYDAAASSAPGDDGEFDLHPYALFFAVRAWYVVGYHSRRDDLRSLKLNRFTKVALTERKCRVPESFDLEKYLGNAWRMIRDGEDVEVEIHFDAEFAQTVADTLWHRTQDIQWHEDDSCTFRCTVAGLSEIEWWVLSMGPHCVVRKPAELARRVRDLAARTAALYPPCG